MKYYQYLCVLIITLVFVAPASAQEEAADQSRESMAQDPTASQWSFQLAYQGMPDYKTDTLSTGAVRPEGAKGFVQFRLVAPIPMKKLTVLPRATVRYTQNKDSEWGLSPTDVFVLVMPKLTEWSTGRFGLGPDIVIPGKEGFGNTEWQYGLAAALIQRFFNDKLIVGLLLQQTWGKSSVEDGGTVKSPFVFNPFANLQLGKGFYAATNDMQAQYDWDTEGVKLPIGARFGYVLVQPTKSFNFYVEYATNLATDKWQGPAAKSQIRLNISMTMPV